MIDQKLLEDESAKQGVTIATLVQSEITSHVTKATSEDAEKVFKENSAKLQGDFEKLEEQIKNFLTAQRLQTRQQEYLQSLRAAAKDRRLPGAASHFPRRGRGRRRSDPRQRECTGHHRGIL